MTVGLVGLNQDLQRERRCHSLLAAVSQISLFLVEDQRLQRLLHFGTPFFRTSLWAQGASQQPTANSQGIAAHLKNESWRHCHSDVKHI